MPVTASLLDLARARREAQADSAMQRARVLFVDDEERILRALQAVFRMQYEVTTTTSGHEALELLKQKHYHLIVSDQRMPEIQGVEVLRQAKEISPATVRVLLTGFADLEAIIGSVNEGEVFRYINKPWANEDLQKTITKAVEVGKALAKVENICLRPEPLPDHDDAQEQHLPDHAKKLNVLFVERSKRTFDIFRSRDEHDIKAMAVETAVEALNAMQLTDFAVLVLAIDQPNQDNLGFLNLLKKEHPHVVMIVVSDMADAGAIIRLVNAARVFRAIFHPVKPGMLSLYIHSALKQAALFREAPALVETQRAAAWDAATDAAASTFSAMVGSRLRSIKSFFTRSHP